MKSVSNCYMKHTLAVAIMAACTSLGVQASESTTPIDRDVLVKVMELHGLSEKDAINRLAAEEAAADLYRSVETMNFPGYAGAWFDADSGKLRVALNDGAQVELLKRIGAVPVRVDWSLGELNAVQADIMKDGALLDGELLRSLHVDFMLNRVAVGAAPGNVEAVRERLARHAGKVTVHEAGDIPELAADVRGGDATRNYTFEQNPFGTGYYPCSVGASVANGFYTAGHCGEGSNDIRWAATYASLGDVEESAYPSSLNTKGDIAWVETDPGWTPVPKINGYSDGIINVPAKWAATNKAAVKEGLNNPTRSASTPIAGRGRCCFPGYPSIDGRISPDFVVPGGVSALFRAHQAKLPCGCSNFRRAIHRFDSANSIST